MDQAVECRYRGRVIGHLTTGPDGWLWYKQVNWNTALESLGAPLECWQLGEDDEWRLIATNLGNGTYVSTGVKDIQ